MRWIKGNRVPKIEIPRIEDGYLDRVTQLETSQGELISRLNKLENKLSTYEFHIQNNYRSNWETFSNEQLSRKSPPFWINLGDLVSARMSLSKNARILDLENSSGLEFIFRESECYYKAVDFLPVGIKRLESQVPASDLEQRFDLILYTPAPNRWSVKVLMNYLDSFCSLLRPGGKFVVGLPLLASESEITMEVIERIKLQSNVFELIEQKAGTVIIVTNGDRNV